MLTGKSNNELLPLRIEWRRVDGRMPIPCQLNKVHKLWKQELHRCASLRLHPRARWAARFTVVIKVAYRFLCSDSARAGSIAVSVCSISQERRCDGLCLSSERQNELNSFQVSRTQSIARILRSISCSPCL